MHTHRSDGATFTSAGVAAALSQDERYFLFCERMRAELSAPAAHKDGWRITHDDVPTSVYERRSPRSAHGEPASVEAFWRQQVAQRRLSSSDEDSAEAPFEALPQDDAVTEPFPACFYTRMILCARASGACGAAGPSRSSSDAHAATAAHVDEDRLAARVADQIRQRSREKAVERRVAARVAESGPLYNGVSIAPYADARLEAQLAALHDESTHLFLHVRRENRQSAELHERLVYSRLLLERTRTVEHHETGLEM